MSQTAQRRISRRRFLECAALVPGVLAFPSFARGEEAFAPSPDAVSAIAKSPLIYLTPLKSDGSESACHSEVWFAGSGRELFVVTSADRWRARAIGRGLDRARIWVGDFGVWKDAGDRFRRAPTFVARGALIPKADAAVIDSALSAFGAKYADAWGKWGPRFENGLADGTRVLIRYRPIGS